jgi:hypothetical protein
MTWSSAVLAVVVTGLSLIGLVSVALAIWAGPRLGLAWRVLRDPAAGERPPAARAAPRAGAPDAAAPPARSEALSLLAILQQEARLVDFLKEPLDTYSDAQIGAAVRDVHRDSGGVLERLFAIRVLRKEAEGTDVTVPPGFDAGTVRLTGALAGAPPYRGQLRHPGWQATKADLPRWTGSVESARTIAPAEIEVR